MIPVVPLTEQVKLAEGFATEINVRSFDPMSMLCGCVQVSRSADPELSSVTAVVPSGSCVAAWVMALSPNQLASVPQSFPELAKK